MAVNLTEFRQQNPQYNPFGDEQLLEALWQTKYKDYPYDKFIDAMENVFGRQGATAEQLSSINERFVGSAEGVYLTKLGRAELANDLFGLVAKVAPVAGQTTIYDPKTRAAIKLEREFRWYDPLMDLANFAASATVAPAAIVIYPEGAIEGIGHALKTTAQASPVLPDGLPNPFYSPEASHEAAKRPFSTFGMTALLAVGGVRGVSKITEARTMARAREVAVEALAVERERALTEAEIAADEVRLAQANAEAAAEMPIALLPPPKFVNLEGVGTWREGAPGLTLPEIIEAQARVKNEPVIRGKDVYNKDYFPTLAEEPFGRLPDQPLNVPPQATDPFGTLPPLERLGEPQQPAPQPFGSLPNISRSIKAAKWVGKSGLPEAAETSKRIRIKAAEEQGKAELKEEAAPTMQVADHPNRIAEPPPDVPFDIVEPKPVPVPEVKAMDRIETGRLRFLDIFNEDFDLSVRKSGERDFRKISGAKVGRLMAVIENREQPITQSVLHKNGNVTLRVGEGENLRIYKMERQVKAEVKVVNPPPETVVGKTLPPEPKATAGGEVRGAVAAKESWEMGLLEYGKSELKRLNRPEIAAQITDAKQVSSFSAQHIVDLKAAIARGENVPQQVLQEYRGTPWADKALAEPAPQLTPEPALKAGVENRPRFIIDSKGNVAKVLNWNQDLPTVVFAKDAYKAIPAIGQSAPKYEMGQGEWRAVTAEDFYQAGKKFKKGTKAEQVLNKWRDNFASELQQGKEQRIGLWAADVAKQGRRKVLQARLARGEEVGKNLLREFEGEDWIKPTAGGKPSYFADPLTMKIGDWVDGMKSTVRWWMDELVRAGESEFRSPEGKKFVDESLRLTEIRGSNNSKFQQNLFDDGIGKLNNREATNLSAVLEGRADPVSVRAEQFAQKAKSRYAEAYKMIIDNGFKIMEYTRETLKNGKVVIKSIERDPREVKNYVTRFVRDNILLDLNRDINKVNVILRDLKAKENLTAEESALSSILSSWMTRRDPFLSSHFYDALEMYKSWGMNEAQAYRFFMKRVQEHTLRKGVFEHPRTAPFPMSFYETDIRLIMPKYFDALARRIAENQVWGKDGEKLHNSKGTGILDILHQVNPEEGRKASYLADIMNGTMDQSMRLPERAQKAADLFVEYEVYSKIYAGTAAIPNALQFGISTIPQMGMHRFVRALWKIASDPEFRKFTHERSGMFTLSRALSIFGGLDPRYSKLRITLDKYMLHHPFNEFNRMQSYLAAATADIWITDLYKFANSEATPRFYKIYALRQLKKFRIDPKAPLTQEILNQKVFRAVVNTQLLKDIMKDPLHMNDPRFRVLGLFQRFSYRQSRFFLHEVLGELRHYNLMPIVRAAILGYLGGEVAVYAKNRTMEFMEGLASLATGNGYEFIDRKRYDGKIFDFSNSKMAAYHAVNNYAAIATAGLFTQILSTSDPSRIIDASDVVKTAGKQLGFTATPVLARELFTSPTEAYDSFMQTWQAKGIREAVRQLPGEVLERVGTLGRAVAKAISSQDKDFIYDLKMAIKINDTAMVDQVLAIAESRGADVGNIVEKAVSQYKREISEAARRDMRATLNEAKRQALNP